ncbi:MAG: hypothetical protein ACYDA6_08560, partial [Solirubrobacteraceae bacterium]
WLVRLLAAPEYFGAHTALPWLALAWTLYGLYQVMLAITGRTRATMRNVPAAHAGLAVNVLLLILLVGHSGADLGIAGAGIALCGAYVVMLAVMLLLTRRLFTVHFEWARLGSLALLLAAVSVSGDLLLPTGEVAGIASRAAWLLLIPLALLGGRFFSPQERAQARALASAARLRAAQARRASSRQEG